MEVSYRGIIWRYYFELLWESEVYSILFQSEVYFENAMLKQTLKATIDCCRFEWFSFYLSHYVAISWR